MLIRLLRLYTNQMACICYRPVQCIIWTQLILTVVVVTSDCWNLNCAKSFTATIYCWNVNDKTAVGSSNLTISTLPLWRAPTDVVSSLTLCRTLTVVFTDSSNVDMLVWVYVSRSAYLTVSRCGISFIIGELEKSNCMLCSVYWSIYTRSLSQRPVLFFSHDVHARLRFRRYRTMWMTKNYNIS